MPKLQIRLLKKNKVFFTGKKKPSYFIFYCQIVQGMLPYLIMTHEIRETEFLRLAEFGREALNSEKLYSGENDNEIII